MITLYQPKSVWGLLNASPFCMKLELYLRMAEIPYISKVANPLKAPNGKVPYIVDGETTLGDSSFIIEYLEKKYSPKLDAHLSKKDKAQALCLQRLFEEHLYFAMVYIRWLTPENWPATREVFFSDLPPGVKQIVPRLIQKKVRRDSQGQGMGRLKPEQIHARAIKDLQAISDYLGDQTYMLDEQISSTDAIAFAWLANILYAPAKSPLKDFVKSNQNLFDYCERLNKEYGKRTTP